MIELVIEAQRKDLGGFQVGRILPFARRRMVGPFIFLDHMGPADFHPGDEGVNVRPHPHIGLSTVTYLFEGEIRHRDSLGNDQTIRPGEVNWMTAGRGISHSERTDKARLASGTRLHGLQAWVALPTEMEEVAPAFANHQGDDLPSFESGGLRAQLVAGSLYGASAKVQTHSPMFYVHWTLQRGTQAGLPAEYSERAAYIVSGKVEIDGHEYAAGRMLVFAPGETIMFTAVEPSSVMLLGGEPVGPRHIWWNFVSSSQDRIDQAKADWRAGRFELPPTDRAEFIPLPEDPPTPPL